MSDAPSERKASVELESVQINAVSMLKIINNCTEKQPEVATGWLMGLDVGARLEVTAAIPKLNGTEKEKEEYRKAAFLHLDQYNGDNYIVGWYLSAFRDEWIDEHSVKGQYSYQKENPASVLIVYDPFSKKNSLSLRAYRLTGAFMKFFEKRNLSHVNFTKFGVDSGNIFEELPIKVLSSSLAAAFLYDAGGKAQYATNFERLEMGSDKEFQQNMDSLGNGVDVLTQDANSFSWNQMQVGKAKKAQEAKRAKQAALSKAAGKAGEKEKKVTYKRLPYLQRLDAFLTSFKIDQYNKRLKGDISQSLFKVFEASVLDSDVANAAGKQT